MSDEELVHLAVDDGVGTVTLDSPANRNALSRRLMADLERQLSLALADDRVRVIVLTGTGTVFCSGADLREQRAANESGRDAGVGTARPTEGRSRGLPGVLTTLWNSPKPVVGRVNGSARAGGLGLVAACDIAVGVQGATFGCSEVRIGVAPAIISVVLVPRLGIAKATELFLTGEPIDAAEAVRIGLLNQAVPPADLDSVTARYVESLLKGAPRALAESKRLVREVPRMDLDAAFAWATELSANLFASEEAHEGMLAFAEKRAPRWAPGGGSSA